MAPFVVTKMDLHIRENGKDYYYSRILFHLTILMRKLKKMVSNYFLDLHSLGITNVFCKCPLIHKG